MSDKPLHISVLEHLITKVGDRRKAHLEDMAKGVDDQKYQRLVGKAAESKVVIEYVEELITRLKKNDLEGVEDNDE